MKMEKIPPFDYLKGEAFTDALKEVTGCKTLLEMSELFDVPKATFSAWNTHDRTSHELIVRLYLAKGIPVKKLALGIDESEKLLTSETSLDRNHHQKEQINPQHQIVILKSFCLTNGQLVATGEIPYAQRIFNSWDLEASNTIEIETNEGRFLVDKKLNDAVSGEYLIDINGRLSLNHIQRLPNKLAVVFGNSTVEVSEEDIKVIGRVAVTLERI
ncbi:helix-turn-helix domain-containing protein [Vibrio cholerae]|uniref:helix-turn-helix domain-containing protein n=1 Tax=Vibrio cholerae TaxID=666 RepID=UPI00027352C0|nr:helix-turn-helix domain-containing protein [Vibrio cholerae]EGR4442208.1 chromosome partitioning protein ParA [Vibrio cholerae]EJH67096.1 bacteriophage CI repressor helix-turn-helix domain protein [Vibrio cholerae HE-25]EJL6314300.1 helix-turn-helix domain-containing protein [Vibrio cholerae]ELJ8606067.1 helix-turn-helix domain-containing protein [Vibrio cholerae]KQA39131.1 chromosome partitioning protein ParA [Vibrio cholerae]